MTAAPVSSLGARLDFRKVRRENLSLLLLVSCHSKESCTLPFFGAQAAAKRFDHAVAKGIDVLDRVATLSPAVFATLHHADLILGNLLRSHLLG